MSELKQLLQVVEVEWKELGKIGEFQRGKRFVKTDLIAEGVPTIHYGEMYTHYGVWADKTKSFVSEELVENKKLRVAENGDVIIVAAGETIEDLGRGTAWLGIEGVVVHDACFSYRSDLNPKYVSYFTRTRQFHDQIKKNISSGKISAINSKGLSKVKIPIPPPKIQQDIVRILDSFAELNTELNTELQKRIKQYRYYSTVLFDNVKHYRLCSIEETCYIKKGITPIQKAIPGKYPMVVTTTERKSCETYQFNAKSVCIPLVSSRGHGVASLNHVYYQEGKFALGNILCAITPKDEKQIDAKYLYYYFEQTKDYTLVPLMKGGANVALRMNDIEKVKVPIPPIEEQARIVSILDKFDTLTTSISEGLPKEIELRQKQYEYYRDLLLTFPKKDLEK